jgi:hypothetical protein
MRTAGSGGPPTGADTGRLAELTSLPRVIPGYLTARSRRTLGSMTAGAAVLGITIALAVGWYGAHWWLAEKDEIAAGNRHANTIKTMWHFRRILVVVAVIGLVVAELWARGKGR